MPLRGLFVTGTDTGVGKTFLTAGIVRFLREQGYRTGAYKPAASGCCPAPEGVMWEDVETLWAALGEQFARERICPQTFQAPLAPPIAARCEGARVDRELLRSGAAWWQEQVDVLVVEGAGGLLSPIADEDVVADLARDLGWPLLVVARAGLGTINHTLLTLEAADRRGLTVTGVVLNHALPATDESSSSNREELAKRCQTPILGVLNHCQSADLLRQESFRRIDWNSLCRNSGGGLR